MIIDHGIKRIRLASLRFPGDIREMMEADEVRELAKTIQDIGLLHPVTIRHKSREIIAGRHRTAAMLYLKKSHIECKVLECSDMEAHLISLIENASRTHSYEERDAAMHELVELYVDWMKEEVEKQPEEISKVSGNVIKKKVSRNRAYQEIAAIVGVSAQTVRKRDVKYKKNTKVYKKRMPGVDTLGMDVTKAFQMSTMAIQRHCDDIDYHIKQAKTKITKLQNKSTLGFPSAIAYRAQEGLSDAGEIMRQYRPTHLCPHCKGLEGYQEACAACHGCGWVGKDEIDKTPEDLLNLSDPKILVQGRLVSVRDIIGSEPVLRKCETIEDLWGEE
ncbi:MAG: ParB/RepB/Spo0J family partition protein [bacterium]